MLDMQHEGWQKQTRQHILLSRKAVDFSFLEGSWSEVIHADEQYAALGRDVFVT